MSRAAGTKYRSARLRLNLRYGYDRDLSRLPSGIFCSHWRLALDRWFFIRNQRLALVACFVFFNEEYLIALVDFIYSSRGRLERDRGFANPLSLSNTSPDPWGNPLRRGILAAAGLGQFRIPVSGAVVTRHVRILYSYLCSALYRSRFSRVVGLVSHVFHYWWVDRSCLRLRGGWLFLS